MLIFFFISTKLRILVIAYLDQHSDDLCKYIVFEFEYPLLMHLIFDNYRFSFLFCIDNVGNIACSAL